MKRRLALIYLGGGIGMSIVTVKVLLDADENTPGEIAYYAIANGLLWPAALIAAVRKGNELAAAKGDVWRDSVGD